MATNRNSSKLLNFATKSSKLVAKSRFNFTKRAIAELPNPPKVRAYFYDTNTRGLAIAISPLGRKVFVLYRKVSGRPERVPIGLFPDVTVEQARGRAAELNGAISRGENPADSKRQVRDEMTLEELFAQYGELHASEKRTWPEMQRMFRVYLHRWHLQKISSIRKVDVVALHANLKRTRGPYLANRVVELLGSMFGRAISDWGWKGTNPAAGVTPSKERKRKRFVLPQEAGEFFRALDAEPNETIRDYIYLSLLTGGRRANVEAMRWAHIDWSRAAWDIPAAEAKEDEDLQIPLIPPALEILERRKRTATSEWVFPGRGRTRHLVEPKRCWQRILEAAGLSDLRLHDLRRTMGSWQALTGSSLPIIGKSLGHAAGSPATAIYARLTDGPVRESMQKATTALLLAGKVDDQEHAAIDMTMDELREFVRISPWKFAKTMPKTPHEYTLREKAPDEKLFEKVVLYIRQAGYKANFGKTTYTYFDIDGWQYWTMGSPLEDTILINRAKTALFAGKVGKARKTT